MSFACGSCIYYNQIFLRKVIFIVSKKLMLLDGHSILNRAFYGVPDLTNSEGIHTNALYGFLNIMFRFIDEENPDYLTVAFDVSAPTFRHKTFSEYKGTRKPMAPELKQQVPLIKELLKSMNVNIVEMEGFEADDLLGTMAKKSAADNIDVTIISGDRDLLQLAEEHIKIRIPKTKKGVTEVEDYLPKDVEELYGVTPLEFIDMKALMGDTSDNIPGAPGVGPKTASALIQQYHSIENIFEHIDEVKPPKAKKSISENMEQVRLSRFLAEINTNVPLDFDIESAKTGEYYTHESYTLFKRFNFKSFLKRFDEENAVTSFEADRYFRCISDFSEAEQALENVKNKLKEKKTIGFVPAYEDGSLFGVSFAIDDKNVFYIPVSGFLTEDYLKEKVVELVSECDSPLICTLNLKDYLDIFRYDKNDSSDTRLKVTEKAFTDVGIAAYLINPNNENYTYDALARDYLGLTVNDRSELLGKSTLAESAFINAEAVIRLFCLSSYVSLMAWNNVRERLQAQEMLSLMFDMEMPLIFVLYDMQALGIRADSEALKKYSAFLGQKAEVLEKEIYDLAGEEFNINSPKQLGVILFEKLGLPNAKKTKSGYSTAADVLDKLAGDYPIVQKILDYRQITKLKSTYADGLVPCIQNDGRIHSTFNQTITATGRISSTDPNLQNIPIRMELGKKIRQVFVPKEDYVFLDADYSQIELRILAHMSGDERLIAAYNSAQDIHATTASHVFNVPFEEVTPELRRNAKAVNFGIVYGISSFGLSQDLSISRKEAAEYIEKYFEAYPGMKQYIDSLVDFAKENGYSLTMYNRRRPIPELKSSNFMQRSFGERVAMNAPIQGTAADIIKLAMIQVYRELKKRGLKSRLILQVHDELLVEAYKDEVEAVKELMIDAMKNVAKLSVELEVDLKQGSNWLEAH
jgi:DNA polymerase-1